MHVGLIGAHRLCAYIPWATPSFRLPQTEPFHLPQAKHFPSPKQRAFHLPHTEAFSTTPKREACLTSLSPPPPSTRLLHRYSPLAAGMWSHPGAHTPAAWSPRHGPPRSEAERPTRTGGGTPGHQQHSTYRWTPIAQHAQVDTNDAAGTVGHQQRSTYRRTPITQHARVDFNDS
eukprot:1157686-Pelagomonas_calceolata.AAC.1